MAARPRVDSGAARALVTGLKLAIEGPLVEWAHSQKMKTGRFSSTLLSEASFGPRLDSLEPRMDPLSLKIDPYPVNPAWAL